MCKKIFILIIIAFFICGCSIREVAVNDYDKLIRQILLGNHHLKNNVFEGYSYYIPRGLKILHREEDNSLLADGYNHIYYVYVDVVSYYNKVKNTYHEDKSSYYSKKIVSKDGKKSGYLEINRIKDKYFVEAVYNYVKIEVYTSQEYLSDVVVNICQILSSTKYNHKVLATIIGDKVLDYKEESFNIFTTKKSNTNYLDYIEKYDSGAVTKHDEENKMDEDILDITIEDD